ncbi:MAG: M13 family metallopeptidase [Minisyncoccia bacterium]
MTKKGWGFDTKNIDASVRPQDDFYHYANGTWLKNNPIPENESRWGAFLILRYDTEKKLRALVTKLQNMKRLEAGTPEQMIRDLYCSAFDMKRRNALGIEPVRPWLDRIQNIKNVRQLVLMLAHLEKIGGAGPWGLGVEQDLKNSEKYLLYIGQSGLCMPDRDYYLNDDAESVRVRTAYVKHVEAIFKLMGKTSAEAKRDRATVMRIETALAKISMTKEDLRDVDKIYCKMRASALGRLAPNIDWDAYLRILGTGKLNEVVVMQPEFMKGANAMLEKEPIEDWKTYLSWRVVNGTSGLLSEKFVKENFSFYGTTLSGVKVMKPLWRRALGAVEGMLGEPLGKLYVQAYFGPDAKKKIVAIVDDLFEAYEARIKNLDWMTPATKRKAIEKLHKINRKLGYPDKWKSYRGLVIKPDDFFGNAIRATLFHHAREIQRLKKPVDRVEWHMTPQTVNAYYSFTLNDIVFPAAILQAPIFSPDADDAVNYGAIGSVIGHEITHGFDDQGAKFDGKGNRKTWWRKEDRARFDKKAEVLKKQFDTYAVADDVKVNGQLTLGENIADLGGASIAFDAYKLRLAKTGRKDIDGFTPEQRFFLGLAVFDSENMRPEAQKMRVLTDPHSPGIFRINGPASNLPEFYEAFGVKKGDKLYRDPNDRAKIW